MIALASTDSALLARWGGAVPGGATQAQQCTELEALLSAHQPQLLLLDLGLAGLGGAAGAVDLIGRTPATRVVVMSRLPSDDEGIAMLRAGARGYCNAYIDPRLLEKVISTVQAGEVWVGRKLIDRLVQLIVTSPAPHRQPIIESAVFDSLTPREREIAVLVGEGVSNKVIARRLDITERTVKAHLGAVFAKLGLPGRLQLALLVTGRAERARAARSGPH
jgi:two-component system nitrate/nitrite response regulator NarL